MVKTVLLPGAPLPCTPRRGNRVSCVNRILIFIYGQHKCIGPTDALFECYSSHANFQHPYKKKKKQIVTCSRDPTDVLHQSLQQRQVSSCSRQGWRSGATCCEALEADSRRSMKNLMSRSSRDEVNNYRPRMHLCFCSFKENRSIHSAELRSTHIAAPSTVQAWNILRSAAAVVRTSPISPGVSPDCSCMSLFTEPAKNAMLTLPPGWH